MQGTGTSSSVNAPMVFPAMAPAPDQLLLVEKKRSETVAGTGADGGNATSQAVAGSQDRDPLQELVGEEVRNRHELE